MTADRPPGLYDRPVLVLDPGMHTARIMCADVNRDGRFAVTASEDKTVRVWTLADGALVRTIRLPAGPGDAGKAYAVAISPDNTTIAVGGWARTYSADIYLFDLDSGVLKGRVSGLSRAVTGLAFSPQGSRLAAVLSRGGMRLFTVGSRCALEELSSDQSYETRSHGLAVSVDGRFATSCWDGRLRLYSPDGRLLRSVATPYDRPFGLAFNPVNDMLAVGFFGHASVLLYDGETLEELQPPDAYRLQVTSPNAGLGDEPNLVSVAWSSNGSTMFAGGTYKDNLGTPVIAWDLESGKRQSIPAGKNAILSLRQLPGEEFLVASTDTSSH